MMQWLQRHLPKLNNTLIVIMNDDIFVEIIHFSEFITALYGEKVSPGTLVCDVITAGTLVQQRSEVRADEVKNVPNYCNRGAYLFTPDLLPKFLAASQRQVRRNAVLFEVNSFLTKK